MAADKGSKLPTDFLRCIAILLIVNSHLDNLYPFPRLGTGGAIGNALFFMLSGYGIAVSAQNSLPQFWTWYIKRLLRIYPSVVFAVIIFIVIPEKAWLNWDVLDYIKNFIWPTPYWFISALMLSYVFAYLAIRTGNSMTFIAAIALLLAPYAYFYATAVDLTRYSIEGPGYFKWIFYLQIMLFGGYLAGRDRFGSVSVARTFFLLIAALTLYYSILLIIDRGYGGFLQALTHLLMFPIVLLFLRLAQSDVVDRKILAHPLLVSVISLISALTLEIYLVHGYFHSNSIILSPGFPANLLLFLCVTFILSFILNRTAGFVREFILRRVSFNNL